MLREKIAQILDQKQLNYVAIASDKDITVTDSIQSVKEYKKSVSRKWSRWEC